jgi:superfamily I DNA/RNA helicase
MSLYKSKGLTADHVFVLGCIEGLIPTYPHEKLPPEDDRRHYEEQRRLFYVAITRAQQTLVLSSTITLPLSFVYHMQIPIRGDDSYVGRTISSTFLGELGQSCPTSLTGNEWMKT